MAVRTGAHAEPLPGRRSLRALARRWGRDGDTVGALLDGMGEAGWHTLHDVDVDGGRIEHLTVGPAGVFAIATSHQSGRVSVERIDERTYAAPYALARRVEAALGRKVTPVLVYRYARLSRPVSRQRGVVVVMTRTLGEHLSRRRARLTDAEVHSLHHQLLGLSGR
jgi:hypothetical protein